VGMSSGTYEENGSQMTISMMHSEYAYSDCSQSASNTSDSQDIDPAYQVVSGIKFDKTTLEMGSLMVRQGEMSNGLTGTFTLDLQQAIPGLGDMDSTASVEHKSDGSYIRATSFVYPSDLPYFGGCTAN